MCFSARFLGVGSAHSQHSSSCVIERHGRPWLMIDCGFQSLSRYQAATQGNLPHAVFVTHLHFDHIGGLEQLFYQSRFQTNHQPRLFVPASLVYRLTQIFSNTGLAEGKVNLWDQLHIVPVLNEFWLDEVKFQVYPVRHHEPGSAYALHLPGVFFYSGDTRPVPEILHHQVRQGEVIFHDVSVKGNPSHTGIQDVLNEYDDEVRSRLVAYHYHDEQDAQLLHEQGIRVAISGTRIHLGATAWQRGMARISA